MFASRVAVLPAAPLGASGPGGGGGPVVRTSGGIGSANGTPWGATLGAALAVSTQRGVDGDPLPLARLPVQHAPHHPKLNASPHEAVPKGLSGFL